VGIQVIGAVLSLERRCWLAAILVWVIALAMEQGRQRRRLLRLAVVGSMVVGVAFLLLRLMLPGVLVETLGQLGQRYDYTFGSTGLDPSSARRFSEMRYVAQEFEQTSPLYRVLGLGQGAEFRDPEFLYESAGSEPGLVHNVHNTYAGTLLRTGAVGLLVTIAFVVLCWRMALRTTRHARRSEGSEFSLDLLLLRAGTIFLFVTFLVDWNVASSMGELPLAVIVGLLAATLRWQRAEMSSPTTLDSPAPASASRFLGE
jgi:O-antigen ligase